MWIMGFFFFAYRLILNVLFTKTAVIKSDLKQILLLMCFTVYLSNMFIYFLCKICIYTLYIGYMHKLNYWFCGSIL